MKTRSVPATLAPILETLELRRPHVVTRALLGEIAEETSVSLAVPVIAERLVRLGWLLPLRTRDAWEFAPAARVGRYRSGDPWIELRALLAHDPDAPVAVGAESAVWELGHTPRQPGRAALAHRPGWRPPKSLDARTVRTESFDWRLPPVEIRGLPVWTESTIVVAAAHRPASHGDWANADVWLPETFRDAELDNVLTEVRGRTLTTMVRLGYLAEWAGRPDIAGHVAELLPDQLPVTYLGPRDRRDRWIKKWRLYDGLLPQR
jgi:AbiEi antitoxin C-terminal domain